MSVRRTCLMPAWARYRVFLKRGLLSQKGDVCCFMFHTPIFSAHAGSLHVLLFNCCVPEDMNSAHPLGGTLRVSLNEVRKGSPV